MELHTGAMDFYKDQFLLAIEAIDVFCLLLSFEGETAHSIKTDQ